MHNGGCNGHDIHIDQDGMSVRQQQVRDLDDAIEVGEAS